MFVKQHSVIPKRAAVTVVLLGSRNVSLCICWWLLTFRWAPLWEREGAYRGKEWTPSLSLFHFNVPVNTAVGNPLSLFFTYWSCWGFVPLRLELKKAPRLFVPQVVSKEDNLFKKCTDVFVQNGKDEKAIEMGENKISNYRVNGSVSGLCANSVWLGLIVLCGLGHSRWHYSRSASSLFPSSALSLSP